MGLFREITKKPWITEQGAVEDLHDGTTFALPPAKLGLRIFMTVITVLFTILAISYSTRTTFPDWNPVPAPTLLWLNTALLVLSSIAMQWARTSARRGRTEGVRNGLIAGGVFAFAFLIGQLLAWQELGYIPSEPAIVFFYLLTGLHGLHLLGGLVAWGRASAKLLQGFEAIDVRLSVELCAVYWHFLLILWVGLFALLLLT